MRPPNSIIRLMQSFFEQILTSESTKHLWEPICEPMNEVPIYEGYLYKANKMNDDKLELRYFILQENYLIYKKTKESSKQTCKLKVSHTRLEFPQTDQSSQLPGLHCKYKFPPSSS